MKFIEAIVDAGLEEGAGKVYLAALEGGPLSMTDLARRAGMKRPTVYLAVQNLILRGLLSEVRKGKRKVYSAAHPKRLVDLSRTRTASVEAAFPELLGLWKGGKGKPLIQMFEGREGVRAVYQELYDSLGAQEEALWFTNIGALAKRFPESLEEYKRLLRRVSHPQIRELNFGDEFGEQWCREIAPLRGKHHAMRLLPPDIPVGFSDMLVFGDRTVMFSFEGEQPFVVVVQSRTITQAHRALFEWAWRAGKEI